MFVNAIKKVEKAMFPIFSIQSLNNQVQIGVAGTGFFIKSDGTFASVAHVFDGKTPELKYFFHGFLPTSVENPALEITEIDRNDEKDIFIGQIKLKTPQFLHISKSSYDVGKSVCISGYPLPEITSNATGGLELGGVRRYFQPSFILDQGVVNSDNGKGKIRIHDGFIIRDFGLYGMSGGPVFDINGEVLGIQGSVTNPRISSNGKESISVQNAIVIKSALIQPYTVK